MPINQNPKLRDTNISVFAKSFCPQSLEKAEGFFFILPENYVFYRSLFLRQKRRQNNSIKLDQQTLSTLEDCHKTRQQQKIPFIRKYEVLRAIFQNKCLIFSPCSSRCCQTLRLPAFSFRSLLWTLLPSFLEQ